MSIDSDEALRNALDALAAESSSRRAPERVEAALVAEFRRRKSHRRARWVATAAAAAILIAVSVAVMRPGRPPARRPAEQAKRSISTGFIPVAYGEPFRPEDGGRIVRVRMPRSSLASFGLPVNEERRGERVQAVVLLGEDNLVRAIRFEQ